MLALGLDASTQSCSAIVIDSAGGTVIAEASVNFGERLPQYGAPSGFTPDGSNGEVHSNPLMWLDALDLLLEDLKAHCDLSRIAVISGAGQQHGSVYLNEKWPDALSTLSPSHSLSLQMGACFSRKTSPIWMDTSTSDECNEITETIGSSEAICAKSGSIAIERFTGPQIRRFCKIDPDGYAKTRHIHLVSSFLCSVLCGRNAPVDTGDGAGMNLLNIDSWAWDDALVKATAPDLKKRLPTVVSGQTIAGALCPYFVHKYGFAPDTPVTVFTGDNPSSLVGMGASRPGHVVISLGTSDTFFAAMPKVVADPQGCGHVFGNPAGGSMSLQCFVNGSLAREAVKDRFGLNWAQFTHALDNTPPGNDGKVMLPFFRPEISPRVDIDAPILKGGPEFEQWRQPEAAIRACVEGQFLNMKRRTEWMQLRPEQIALTGGASKNEAIAQVVADVFQTDVVRLSIDSSVALGAALRAASHSTQLDLPSLESLFCRTEPDSRLSPKAAPEALDRNQARLREILECL
jgi:xylulokinase